MTRAFEVLLIFAASPDLSGALISPWELATLSPEFKSFALGSAPVNAPDRDAIPWGETPWPQGYFDTQRSGQQSRSWLGRKYGAR